MKKAFFKISKAIIAMGTVLIGSSLIMCLGFIFIFLFGGDIVDHVSYKDSLQTKEDVFQMVYDYQEEYEKLGQDMAEILAESGDDFILLREWGEYRSYGIESNLIEEFPIIYTAAQIKEDGYLEVGLAFAFPPRPYSHWGIYYSESGEPLPQDSGELKEENGIFVEKGRYSNNEMEKIVGNWYYYQGRTFR